MGVAMLCRCGRSTLHCPLCGSGDVYGLKRLTVKTDSGDVRGFRCRKCSAEFREGTQCTAERKVTKTKLVEKIMRQQNVSQDTASTIAELKRKGLL